MKEFSDRMNRMLFLNPQSSILKTIQYILSKKNMKFVLFAFLAMVMVVIPADSKTIPAKNKKTIPLPATLDGWKKKKGQSRYTKKTIFTYLSGAGEIYNAYDLVSLKVQEYRKPSAPSVIVEIYELSSSKNAYGISTFNTDGKYIRIGGRKAIYGAGLLRFWKGPFFVRLLAERETPEARVFLEKLAGHMLQKITQSDSLPEILNWLPQKGLQTSSIRYFHTKAVLDTHYLLSNQNILNLNKDTEVLLARYRVNKEKIRVMIAKYPSKNEALAASEKFQRFYLNRSDFGRSIIQKIEKETYVSLKLKDDALLLVFEAAHAISAHTIMGALQKKIQGEQK